MHLHTRKPHKTPEPPHKNPTAKKDKDPQPFFDEGDAEPGPEEGKVLLASLAGAAVFGVAISIAVIYYNAS